VVARFTTPGPRPVRVYRLEERNLRTGTVCVLVGGHPDRDTLVAMLDVILADQTRRGGRRYAAPDPPYRLLVISDGWQQAPQRRASGVGEVVGEHAPALV
jgi:hypothetical protein